MRIGAGEYRGRTLKTPKGEATRPTSGLVRASLFNILATHIPDARVLDLYAGCGSVGLEALSHGARHVTFVECARPALACLRENIAVLDVSEQSSVLPYPAERALELLTSREQFEIIFLDPPFAQTPVYLAVLAKVAAAQLLATTGLLIAQHDARLALPDQLATLCCIRRQRIGDNMLSFYRDIGSNDSVNTKTQRHEDTKE